MSPGRPMKVRWSGLMLTGILCCGATLPAASGPAVELELDRTAPRAVEEQTARAIVRDYGAAWLALSQALEQSRPQPLGDLWTGFAKQQVLDAISRQQASGVRVHYADQGHKLEAVFYSPEGSALELHDTATVERRIMDGDKVITSDR